ncbi:MAG: endonuclease/exonuclease/phosphatase family protein [Nitratireductor sp.]
MRNLLKQFLSSKYVLPLTRVACAGLLLAIGLSFLNSVHPAFDTIANFRVHMAWVCAAAFIFWLLLKNFNNAAIMLFVGIASAGSSVSGIYNPFNKESAEAPNTYSLIHYNVKYNNTQRNKVLEMLLREDPDIFTGVEINNLWSDAVYRLSKKYAHVFHCPEWGSRGGGYIFSKFPFTNKQPYCHEFAALGVQEVMIEGLPVSIGAAHLRWPWPASQPEQLIALTPYLNTLEPDALIAGDFNAATWTHAMKTFAKQGELEIVSGVGGTWTFDGWLSFLAPVFGLPIDNVLHKGRVKILSAKTLKTNGSDHLPIKVVFSIQK